MRLVSTHHLNSYRADHARIVEAAEHLLMTERPIAHNPYFELAQGPGLSEPTLQPYHWAGFEYHWLCSDESETDEQALAKNPFFREEAVLGAIVELLRFCQRNLKNPESDRWHNAYFTSDLVGICRRHLTQLLGRWYELQRSHRAAS